MTAALLLLSVGAAAAHAYSDGEAPEAPRALQEQKPAPSRKDVGQLRPGESRRQGMDGGESHVFHVAVVQGQYLRAVVTQEGIDVVVSFFEPGAESALVQMDGPNGMHGPESVSLVTTASAEYLLEVRSDDKGAMPGRYEVRLDPLREPTEADLRRVKAEAAYLEGARLARQGTEAASKEAVAKYTEALGLWRSLNDRYAEACVLYALGQTYHRARGRVEAARDNLTAARDSLNQALVIFRELNDLFGQAMVNNDTGAAIRDLDSPRNALPFYNRAYELYQRAGDLWGQALMRNNIGIAHARLGDFREALVHLEQSLPVWQAARDRGMEANAYNNIGGMFRELSDPTQALANYQRALSIWQETGSSRLASVYNNIAVISHGFGDTQAALDNYERTLALHSEQKNAAGEANVLNNIGMVYADMGDAETALARFNESQQRWESLGQKRGQAQALDNTGYALYLLGRYDEALGQYQQARRLFAEAGDRQGESYALTHIGMIYAARGDAPKALDSYELARKIQQDGGMKLGLAITLDKIADAHRSAGDAERAAAFFREALALWADLGEGNGRARSLYGLARVESARGNLAAARDAVEQAIKIVESLRVRTANQQLRTTLLASKHEYYELDVDVKMRLGGQSPAGAFVEAAFESSEQGRARSLADILFEGRAGVRPQVKPELAAEEVELQRRLGAVSDRLLMLRGSSVRAQDAARVSDEVEALKKMFDALSARYDNVLARIRSQSPRYAQLTQPTPLKVTSLRELLDADTLLLEYSLGDERSYLWAVTRAGIEGFPLPGRAKIQQAAEEFRELIVGYGSRQPGEDDKQYLARLREFPRQYPQRAAELGQLVLGPVAGRIGSKRLVVVADGALQYIPFEALFAPSVPEEAAATPRPAGGDDAPRPLGITNEVIYLPSASTLALLRAAKRPRPAPKNVAVFADPVFDDKDVRVAAANRQVAPSAHVAANRAALGRALRDVDLTAGDVRLERLPYTSVEAEAITSVVPPKSAMKAVGFGASRTKATSPALRDYRIVHFATHALLDDKRPELSGLVMSLVDKRGRPQDGFLRLGDIYHLNLPVDMVVLSACRTGIGREVRGEGLVGLTRGFMYAGASRVVASLWRVDDEATSELMKSFYRHMLKGGLPAAAALRLAKSELMEARAEWRSPYFWAGFVLQGDWRPSQTDRTASKHSTSSGVR